MSLVTLRRNREWFESVKGELANFWLDVESKRKIIQDNPESINTIFAISATSKRKRTELCNSEVCLILDD